MICRDIINIIENKVPLGLAYSWDNSGFLCGDINKEVKRVYITLDVNMYTMDEAVSVGADMIISHHPIMFGGIKRVDFNSPSGYVLRRLIENGISLYASHTPLDCTKGGINDTLADKLGIGDKEIIEPNKEFKGCGLGRIGALKKQMTLAEFAELVKRELNTPFVRICGEPDSIIRKVAVGGGACDDLIPVAKVMGADVMVTADMKYHISMDSVESGICVIDAGHYPTEQFAIDIFADMLAGYEIEIIRSTETDVFCTV